MYLGVEIKFKKNCFLSSVATNGKDVHGLKFENYAPLGLQKS